jgi:hypothetical protein
VTVGVYRGEEMGPLERPVEEGELLQEKRSKM